MVHIHAEQTIKTNSITFPADLCSEREEAGQGLHAVVEFLRKGEDDQPRKRELWDRWRLLQPRSQAAKRSEQIFYFNPIIVNNEQLRYNEISNRICLN